jgi:hypothetical protein
VVAILFYPTISPICLPFIALGVMGLITCCNYNPNTAAECHEDHQYGGAPVIYNAPVYKETDPLTGGPPSYQQAPPAYQTSNAPSSAPPSYANNAPNSAPPSYSAAPSYANADEFAK